MALNTVLPARSGEAAKVVLVRTRIPGSSVATIASSSSVLLIADTVLGLALVSGGLVVRSPAAAAAALDPERRPPRVVPVVALAAFAGYRFAPRLRGVGRQLRQGFAILGTPSAYLRRVAAPQLGAWLCRVGVAASLLAAFHISGAALGRRARRSSPAASRPPCPTPGGMGTQQALVVVALHGTVSAAGAFSFSVALQLLVTRRERDGRRRRDDAAGADVEAAGGGPRGPRRRAVAPV